MSMWQVSYWTQQKDSKKTFSPHLFALWCFSRVAASRWRSRHPCWVGESKQGCSASPGLDRVWWGRTKQCEILARLWILHGFLDPSGQRGLLAVFTLFCRVLGFCNFSQTREACGLITVEVANFILVIWILCDKVIMQQWEYPSNAH